MLNFVIDPVIKLKQLVDELRGSMFNRLTQKQAEADDEIFCIRRTNQRRVETEAQIVKLKSELNKVECEKQSEHDKRQDQINTLKNEIDLVRQTLSKDLGNRDGLRPLSLAQVDILLSDLFKPYNSIG